MSLVELEVKELLINRFGNPHLVAKILRSWRDRWRFEWREIHYEITETLLFLNSSRYPGYCLFHYGPHVRKYCGAEHLYTPTDSDSE